MLELKRATEADADLLTALGRSTFVETFAPDNRPEDLATYVAEAFYPARQLAEIRDPNRVIEIARIGGEAVGYLHMRVGHPDASVAGPRPIEILRLYVDSRWHGKGVARELMDAAFRIARDLSRETIWLGVWERNLRAKAFYAKYGFREVGSHHFRLGSDDQKDLILALPVPNFRT